MLKGVETVNEKNNLVCQYIRNSWAYTIKAKEQARYANILGTPEHDAIKAKKQTGYANTLGTPEHDKVKARKRKLYANTTAMCSNDFSGNVKKFRLEIEKGPYFNGCRK